MKREQIIRVVLPFVILGILVAIALSSFLVARNNSRREACIGNRQLLDSAKEQWAMANRAPKGTTCTMGDLFVSNDLVNSYMKASPICQGGGTYTLGAIGTPPSCSKHGALK